MRLIICLPVEFSGIIRRRKQTDYSGNDKPAPKRGQELYICINKHRTGMPVLRFPFRVSGLTEFSLLHFKLNTAVSGARYSSQGPAQNALPLFPFRKGRPLTDCLR